MERNPESKVHYLKMQYILFSFLNSTYLLKEKKSNLWLFKIRFKSRVTVGLKDLPRSYLPRGRALRPHSSNICTEPVQSMTCQPGQERSAGRTCQAQHLSWTGPQCSPEPAFPCPSSLSALPVGLSAHKDHILPTPKDPISSIPSALRERVMSLKVTPSHPLLFLQPKDRKWLSQNHTARTGPPPLRQSLHSFPPHYSLSCGHHVYTVPSSPKDGWGVAQASKKSGEMLPPGDSMYIWAGTRDC